MLENDNSVIHLDSKASPAILAGIFGVNVSLLYQHAQDGRLPPSIKDATYRECIQWQISWYKKNTEYKLRKMEMERERKNKDKSSSMDSFSDDNLSPLQIAKVKQGIRLDHAKETELWLKIAIQREKFLSIIELSKLAIPFLTTIKDILLTIALDFPETQNKIDSCLESLYNLGKVLLEKAEEDKKDFVEKMLEKDIDFDNLKNSPFDDKGVENV